MTSAPRISVLLPIYNDASYVPQAMDAMLNQTFTDFELLVTDDGSTDDTLSVLKDYAAKDQRVKIHSRPNRGLVYSLNEGLERARAPFIARMDADDWSHPTRFARQLEFLEANPEVGVLGTGVEIIRHNGSRDDYHYPVDNADLRTLMFFHVPFAHSVVMYRKSILDQHQIRYREEFRHAEDFDIYEQISAVSKLANLHDILHRVQGRPDSVSETHQDVSRANRLKVMQRVFEREGIPVELDDLRAAMGYECDRPAMLRSVGLFNRMIEKSKPKDKGPMAVTLQRRFRRNIDLMYGLSGFFSYLSSSVRRYGSASFSQEIQLFIKASRRTAKNLLRRLGGKS